jgi:hypothetical protein
MREMKGKCLAGLVLAFLLAPLVRADGLDHFVWERTDGPPFNTYTWDWASSGPASEFTGFTQPAICLVPPSFTTSVPCMVNYSAIFGTSGSDSFMMLNCTSPPYDSNCAPEDTYSTNFAGNFFSEVGGVITFIPGTYTPATDMISFTDAILTITPAPEPPTVILLLSGAAVGLLLLRRLH